MDTYPRVVHAVRIAVVGDVHLLWDARDVAAMDEAQYDLVLFVGDLAGYRPDGAVAVARTIAQLRTPALVLPGNHDGTTLPQLAAEVFAAPERVCDALAKGMSRRVDDLARALDPVPLVGFSVHRYPRLRVTVLAARPHSMGGPRLGFRRFYEERYGVRSLGDSAARLKSLFDEIPSEDRIVVLGHCGPRGLGDRRADIFGCDFKREEGDFGDPDLEQALAHAQATGKRVLAVVAGHMHHRLRGGGQRRWQVLQDGIAYVNAARVPRRRIRSSGEETHHVRVSLTESDVAVEEVWTRLS